MNRAQRRAGPKKPELPPGVTASRYTKPTALRFICAGLDGKSCPDGAAIGLVLDPKRGISLDFLAEKLREGDWRLGVFDLNPEIIGHDTLCPSCGRKLEERIGIRPSIG